MAATFVSAGTWAACTGFSVLSISGEDADANGIPDITESLFSNPIAPGPWADHWSNAHGEAFPWPISPFSMEVEQNPNLVKLFRFSGGLTTGEINLDNFDSIPDQHIVNRKKRGSIKSFQELVDKLKDAARRGDNAEVEKQWKRIQIIQNVVKDASKFSVSSWRHALNHCQAWAMGFIKSQDAKPDRGYQLDLVGWTYNAYSSWPEWYRLRHAAVKVTLDNDTWFYLDDSWWGSVFFDDGRCQVSIATKS